MVIVGFRVRASLISEALSLGGRQQHQQLSTAKTQPQAEGDAQLPAAPSTPRDELGMGMFGPSSTLVPVQALLLLAGFAPSFRLRLVHKSRDEDKEPPGCASFREVSPGDTPGCVRPWWRCSPTQFVQPVTNLCGSITVKNRAGKG